VISEALNYDTLFAPPSTTAKNISLRFYQGIIQGALIKTPHLSMGRFRLLIA